LVVVATTTWPTLSRSSRPLFELDADLSTEARFYDLPYPSDARLTEAGGPDVSGFLNQADSPLVNGLLEATPRRPGFAVVPVGYFRFSGAIAPMMPLDVIAADAASPVHLIDVDPDSPTHGALFPVVAETLTVDHYTPSNVLAIAARPGFVLNADRTYAFVVTDRVIDAAGKPVTASDTFLAAMNGTASGARADAVSDTLVDIAPALDAAGIAQGSVVSATVFTTGDVVRETAELGDKVLANTTVALVDLAVDPDDGASLARFCELHATVDFPQYQPGEPPFKTEGVFEFDAAGLPIEQRTEEARVVISLPNEEMPAGGYPLVMYFHGSGGIATQVVDRGRVLVEGGPTTKGEGPSHVLAAHGFATVGSSHPVSPDRLPGASDIAYLNLDNPVAFADLFRQGVIEQRLLLDALLTLEIDPTTVSTCTNLSLPAGETHYRFAASPVLAMGQSMGGMYTNMIGATEPRIEAVVPTGAGGFWTYFILETTLVGGKTLVSLLLDTEVELSHLHPALSLAQTAWEPAEPMVYMPRLARRPLGGHPVRPIYEPVGKGDSFFPIQLYDAIVLAYGHEQAGTEVWPSMQESLALSELDGFISYPIENNLSSDGDAPFTGIVVQYEGDGIYDPHSIYGQLDDVKHQYGCFFETFLETGTGVVVAPAALGSPCE
jgi:hypothetical protein